MFLLWLENRSLTALLRINMTHFLYLHCECSNVYQKSPQCLKSAYELHLVLQLVQRIFSVCEFFTVFLYIKIISYFGQTVCESDTTSRHLLFKKPYIQYSLEPENGVVTVFLKKLPCQTLQCKRFAFYYNLFIDQKVCRYPLRLNDYGNINLYKEKVF